MTCVLGKLKHNFPLIMLLTWTSYLVIVNEPLPINTNALDNH